MVSREKQVSLQAVGSGYNDNKQKAAEKHMKEYLNYQEMAETAAKMIGEDV